MSSDFAFAADPVTFARTRLGFFPDRPGPPSSASPAAPPAPSPWSSDPLP